MKAPRKLKIKQNVVNDFLSITFPKKHLFFLIMSTEIRENLVEFPSVDRNSKQTNVFSETQSKGENFLSFFRIVLEYAAHIYTCRRQSSCVTISATNIMR